jgi:hypothetical protein
MNAICAGCGRASDGSGVYGKDNPVEDDGTYADGKYVCDGCYVELTLMGRDVGTPEQLQFWASRRCWLKAKLEEDKP